MFPWSIPPPVADELAGAPGAPPAPNPAIPDLPPWLLQAAAAPPPDAVPPPPTPPVPPPAPPRPELPPPVAPELRGAPGAPQPPPVAGPPPVDQHPAVVTPNKNAPPMEAGPPDAVSGPGETPPYAMSPRELDRAESESIAKSTDLQAQQAEAKAQGLAKQAEYEAAAVRNARMQEMERREDLRAREAQLEQERLAIANTQIDPNQWWSSRTEKQKSAAYIFSFLGGINAVFNNGKNDFTDFMQQQVAQNLEVQKANLANRKDALEAGQSMYGQLLRRYGDERVADQMFVAMSYDALGHQAAAQAAQFDSPIVKQNGVAMQIAAAKQARAATAAAAQAQQEMALKQQQVAIQRQEAGIRAYEAKTGRMGAELANRRQGWQENTDVAQLALEYQKLGMSRQDAEAKARADAAKNNMELEKWEADKRGRMVFLPNGQPMIDPSTGQPFLEGNAEIAKKDRIQLNNTWAFRRELTEYLDIMDHAGNEFSGMPGMSATDAWARAQQLHKSMMFKVKNSQGTGALDKGMVDVFNDYVAPPKEWLGKSNPTASARKGLESWREDTNNTYRMEYGYRGNFVDDWDAQVTPKKEETPTSPWLKAHQERQQNITEDSYDVGPIGPQGPPKPMGMRGPPEGPPASMANAPTARPEELSRPRPPASARPVDPALQAETDARVNFMESYPVTLRTPQGDIKVPLGSLNERNVFAGEDGVFYPVNALPPEVKVVPFDMAEQQLSDQAWDEWDRRNKTRPEDRRAGG